MKKTLLVESAIRIKPLDKKLYESSGGKSGLGYIVETAASGLLKVKLPATTLDQKNENGRNYSTSIMEGACQRTAKQFESRELLSSVNEHPEEPYVTPGQASHIVTNAWCENGHLWNEWEVMNTASGKDLRALIEAGASFGVSIRGLGSMDNYGNIQEDYEYLGTDCVGQPSARIRTNPTEVNESAQPALATSSASLNESRPQGTDTMKTKAEALKFVSEQSTLMKTESLLEAAQRVMTVEGALAASSVPPKDLVECYGLLETAKAALGGSTPAALNESAGESVADLKKKLEALTAASRKQIGEMATQFKASQAALRKEADEAGAKVLAAEKAGKLAKAKYETLLGKHAEALKEAKKVGTKYEALVKRTGRLVIGFQAARSLAVESTAKYNALLKVSGKLVKESKKAPKPAAVVESGKGTVATAPVVRTEAVQSTRKVVGERHVTSANRSGATQVPVFI